MTRAATAKINSHTVHADINTSLEVKVGGTVSFRQRGASPLRALVLEGRRKGSAESRSPTQLCRVAPHVAL